MDRARPHTSKMTTGFISRQSRLHVFHLPPYSPDWNPDERACNHPENHELKAHQARCVPQMRALADKKPGGMAENPSLLKGLFYRCCIAPLFE